LPTPASPTVGAHRPGQPTRQRTSERTRPSGPFRSAALPSPIGENHDRPQWDLPTTPNSPTLRQCLAWLDLRGLSVLSMGQIPGPPRPKAGARRAEAGRRLRAAGGTGRGNSDGGVGDRVGRARQMITRNRGYVPQGPTAVIPIVIPPGATRPVRSALAGRPTQPDLQGDHAPALSGRLAAVL
jgi:hypothetical protein